VGNVGIGDEKARRGETVSLTILRHKKHDLTANTLVW
jgi:hypothetical protein